MIIYRFVPNLSLLKFEIKRDCQFNFFQNLSNALKVKYGVQYKVFQTLY